MAKEDLGTWLVNRGELSAARLEDVFQHQVIYGGSLDTNLLEMSLLPEDKLLALLGQYHALPTAGPDVLLPADPDKLKIFPPKLATKYQAVPFRLEGRNLSLAVNTLPDLSTLDDIGFMLSVYIRPCAALEVRIHQALLRMYGVPLPARMEHLLAQMGEDADEDRATWQARAGVRAGPPPLPKEAWVAQEPGRRSAPPPPPAASKPAPGLPPPLPADAFAARPEDSAALARASRELDNLIPTALAEPLNNGSAPAPAPAAAPAVPPPLPAHATLDSDLPAAPTGRSAPPPLPRDDASPAEPGAAAPPESAGSPSGVVAGDAAAQAVASSTVDELPEDVPQPPAVDPVFDDPDSVDRLRRRSERVTWSLSDARAELALAATRDDVVEVLLRFAYKGLGYAAVFVLQGNQFNGWDSIGPDEAPRALARLRISPAPGTALALVEQTGSHYLGPLKPSDPLPAAVGRAPPKAALLAPFFVKGRMVGVLYGERALKPIPPRHAADLQTLTPDVGRMLESLILRQKRSRLGFVDERPADGTVGIRDALSTGPDSVPPLPPGDAAPPAPAVSSQQPTLPPTPAALALLNRENSQADIMRERSARRADELPTGAPQAPIAQEPPPGPALGAPPAQEATAPLAPVPAPQAAPPADPLNTAERSAHSPQAAPPPIPVMAEAPALPPQPVSERALSSSASADPSGAQAPAASTQDSVPPPLPPGQPRDVLPETDEVVLPVVSGGSPTLVMPATPDAGVDGPMPPPMDTRGFTAETLEITQPAWASRPTQQIPALPRAAHQEEYVAPPAEWGAVPDVDSAAVSAAATLGARLPPAPPAASPQPNEAAPPLPAPSPPPSAAAVAPAAEVPASQRPPPLPHKRAPTQATLQAVAAPDAPPAQPPAVPAPAAPAPASESPRTVDPAEVSVRHAAEILREAERARANRLVDLAESLIRLPRDRTTDELLEKATGRGTAATPSLEVLAARRGLATAAVLRAFPGPLLGNVFADEGASSLELRDLTPLSRVFARLGDVAGALVAAWGAHQARRETRYVAVLLAREVQHASMAEVVAARVFDEQPRVAYLAAGALARMLRSSDSRQVAASGALTLVKDALEGTNTQAREAAIRAASVVHDTGFVAPLIEVLNGSDKDAAEAALRALRDITQQDFGTAVKKWRAWHKENGAKRRTEWLIEALGHKEREQRQGAQRDLAAITGEYLGYYFDAPKAERDAATARWRAWWEQNRNRAELP